MSLPENNRIQKLLTIEEIAAEIESADYSAELLLQHLIVHWNRRDEWQPIETAPKDRTAILAILGGCKTPYPIRFKNGEWCNCWDGCALVGDDTPTAWQPLPPPPSHE